VAIRDMGLDRENVHNARRQQQQRCRGNQMQWQCRRW
jgi:hypothetical protein